MRVPKRSPAVELRRLRVAEYLAANPGASYDQIGRAVGCSPSTAYRDRLAVLAEWAQRRQEFCDQLVAEDLVRTDQAIAAIWPAVTRGDLLAVDRLVSLLSYRIRTVGLVPVGTAASKIVVEYVRADRASTDPDPAA